MTGLRTRLSIDRTTGGVLVLVAIFAPLIFNSYWVGTLLTDALILGILAATPDLPVGLRRHGFARPGGAVRDRRLRDRQPDHHRQHQGPESRLDAAGRRSPSRSASLSSSGWCSAPWRGRSLGIYFLMITLTFSVIANLFFGQVTTFSGFGGISGIPDPELHRQPRVGIPIGLYYRQRWSLALLVYAVLRYVARTPFGLTLQGIRDDPVRMSSLGYNVALHRTLAFGFMSVVAAIAGILFAWWNGHVDPVTIGIWAHDQRPDHRRHRRPLALEGAWIGRAGLRDPQQLRPADRSSRRPLRDRDRRHLPGHRARVTRTG